MIDGTRKIAVPIVIPTTIRANRPVPMTRGSAFRGVVACSAMDPFRLTGWGRCGLPQSRASREIGYIGVTRTAMGSR